eukprot:scaffold29257_cov77-Skeletonema_marinoi.AAC.1
MKIVSDRKRMVKYNGRWILNGKDDEEEDVSLSSAASGECRGLQINDREAPGSGLRGRPEPKSGGLSSTSLTIWRKRGVFPPYQ